MSNQVKVKINKIIESQIPGFIAEENENFVDFLKQYYIAQEYFGGPIDIARNVNQYKKLDYISESKLVESSTLTSNITYFAETISVSSTHGYPDEYGLLKIDDEIITYTGKTNTTFTGCIRGFSGVEKLGKQGDFNELVFSQTSSSDHNSGSVVTNLSNLFLREFFTKLKTLYSPGFEDRDFYSGLNDANFVKQVKDFYKSKGTEESFKILFRVLYGEPVEVVNPSKYLFTPSAGNWTVSRTIVCESISGDPKKLKGSTISNESGTVSAVVSNVFSLRSSNKLYYKIQLDRDTVFIDFEDTPRTFSLDKINSNHSTIYVDSTIGFPNSGQLLIKSDEDSTIVNYSNKTLNEFIGCSGIGLTTIGKSFDYFAIAFNNKNLITGIDNEGNEVVLSISSLISDLDVQEDNHNFLAKDTINIKSIGYDVSDDLKFTQWIYNVRSSHKVKSIVSQGGGQYLITLTDSNHIIKNNNELELIFDNSIVDAVTLNVDSLKRVQIYTTDFIDTTKSFYIRRKLTKSSGITDRPYLTDVESTYLGSDGNVYVSSAALPSHEILATNRSKTFNTSNVNLDSSITVTNHQFLTGEEIHYQPVNGNPITGITTSSYFIKKINEDLIELYQSRNDIYTNKKILLSTDSGSISITHQITPKLLENKFTTAQNLLKKIPSVPSDKKTLEKITSEDVGILVNGVEIFSAKANIDIFYGPLEDVQVLRSNDEFDVVNTPKLKVTSNNEDGSGAELIPHVNGSFKEIIVDNPGFDFLETPNVSIKGGNGTNFNAEVVLKRVQHIVTVSADSSNVIGIGTTVSTITFNNHEFKTGDSVVYNSLGFTGLAVSTLTGTGNIQTNDILYIGKVDNNTFKLYETEVNALSGINTITILNYSNGNNSFRLTRDISKIDSIIINDPGINYRNNTIKVDSNQYPIDNFTDTVSRLSVRTGINTFDNYIFAKNHGFENGDLISYQTTGTSISGLSTSNQYYVIKVDNDKFSVCDAGNENEFGTLNYDQRNIINLKSVGVGTHTFRYPEIKVSVIGQTSKGIVSLEQTPIVRGKIENVFIYKGGTKYGASDIINYHLRPSISVLSGSGASAGAIIKDSKINSVYITNYGKGYTSPPEIVVLGDGTNAVLRSTIDSNTGKLSGISVVNPGSGYSYVKIRFIPQGSLYTKVLDSSGRVVDIKIQDVRGTDISASFKSSVKKWTFDLFRRYFKTFNSSDDGLIVRSSNVTLGNKYCNVFPSRKLRYQVGDNINVDGSEVNNPTHSPILGWAYDGNPIYGPYGYNANNQIVRVKTSYQVISNISDSDGLRPPLSQFPLKTFVDDYVYNGNGDLDENNGRYVQTPEYPNGVYAYFTTIDESISSNAPFVGSNEPVYPYVIGDSFTNEPETFNIKQRFDYQLIDREYQNLIKDAQPYGINQSDIFYEFIDRNYKEVDFRYTVDSVEDKNNVVNFIEVVDGGSNYKVNDTILFDDDGTEGIGAQGVVSELKGKNISSIVAITSSYTNSDFGFDGKVVSGVTTIPHGIKSGSYVYVDALRTKDTNPNNDIIDIQYFKNIAGYRKISVENASAKLVIGLSSYSGAPVTGFTTNIVVNENVNDINFKENDIIQLKSGSYTEFALIDQILPSINGYKVLRGYNLNNPSSPISSGSSISIGSTITLQPTRFTYSVPGVGTDGSLVIDRTVNFDPRNSVGLGTTGTYNSNGSLFINGQTIYIQNHKFSTGDKVIYSNLSGSNINVSIGNTLSPLVDLTTFSDLYVYKYDNDRIGLTTSRVSVGSTTGQLYFVTYGSGSIHRLKTDKKESLTGKVTYKFATVNTSEDPKLNIGDSIKLDVVPIGVQTSRLVYYPNQRKLVANPLGISSTSVGIGTSSSIFTKSSHGFKTGDKILYLSNSPASPLENGNNYYVLRIDDNTFRLSDTYYNATRLDYKYIVLSNSGVGIHTIAPINPELSFIKNKEVRIDVSDSSLSDFRLDFYNDRNFISEVNDKNIIRSGVPGVSTVAYVAFSSSFAVGSYYYKLTPLRLQDPTNSKKINLDFDLEVPENTKITFVDNAINGRYSIGVASTNYFSIEINPAKFIETSTYTSSNSSSISYTTTSTTAIGTVSSAKVVFGGIGYKKLPSIVGIGTSIEIINGIKKPVSNTGSGAILKPISNSIGKIVNTSFDLLGYNLPYDKTLRPIANIPVSLELSDNYSIDYVQIVSGGKNYNELPSLIVLDKETRQINNTIQLDSKFANGSIKSVSVVQNDFTLSSSDLEIVSINNSNGIGIENVSYLGSNITLTLVEPNIQSNYTFPFAVGDQVFVENIPSNGYNSSDYGYVFFTVTGINTSNRTLTFTTPNNSYTLSSVNSSLLSSSLVSNKKNLPVLNPILVQNKYFVNENVKVNNVVVGKFANYYSDNQAKVILIGDKKISKGDVLVGESSNTTSTILKTESFTGQFIVSSAIDEKLGWLSDNAKPSNNLQKLQDNNYYQKFAYSLKSNIPFSVWEEPVGSLNHISGFKKFGDTNLIKNVSFGSTTRSIDPILKVNIENTAKIYKKTSIDYVTDEISEVITSPLTSDGILFESLVLSDFIESKTNYVLSVDNLTFDGITSSFTLRNNNESILHKTFVGSASTIVDTTTSRIKVTSHLFSTGEQLVYNHNGTPIGIATTTITGVGSTDKLPSKVYAIVVDGDYIKVAETRDKALSGTNLTLTSVGVGNTHTLSCFNANTRCIFTIDNQIKKPLYNKNISCSLLVGIGSTNVNVSLAGTSIPVQYDTYLQMDSEIARISSVSFGSTTTNLILERSLFGTVASSHTTGSSLTVLDGEYRIDLGKIFFANAPLEGSTFHGRVFYKNDYEINTIFDDLIPNISIASSTSTLKVNNTNVGILSASGGIDVAPYGIFLTRNVFQRPTIDYNLDVTSGISTYQFVKSSGEQTEDFIPNVGLLEDLSQSSSYGYQPLVAAAATVSVSAGGTITNVWVTNPGSGYVTAPTIVNITGPTGSGASLTALVGVGTSVGIITGFTINNGGSGYASTSIVKVEPPLNYVSLPLVYSSVSSGVGTGGKVDLIVSIGSSVTQYFVKDVGSGYKPGEILTVAGIHTVAGVGSTFQEFRLTVDRVFTNDLMGWTFGKLKVIKDISSSFNGIKKKFDLIDVLTDSILSVNKSRSNLLLNLQNTLLVFINDILQIPGESYTFDGGSKITFLEAPSTGDKCFIALYVGSDNDVALKDIVATISPGDILQIMRRNKTHTDQLPRSVRKISSQDVVDTFPYSNQGVIDPSVNPILRTIDWEKQTFDTLVDGEILYKSRESLDPLIRPVTRLIKPIKTSDTDFYVENAYPLFTVDNLLEKDLSIEVIGLTELESASLTSTIGIGGTVTSISIVNAGIAYTNSPIDLVPKVLVSTREINKLKLNNWNEISYSLDVDLFSESYNGNLSISVGSSLSLVKTTNYRSFEKSQISSGSTTLNAIKYGSYDDTWMVGGNNGYLRVSSNNGTTWSSVGFSSVTDALGSTLVAISSVSTINSISYDDNQGRFVGVGSNGLLFTYDKNNEFTSQYGNNIIVRKFNTGTVNNNLRKVNFSNVSSSRKQYVAVGENSLVALSANILAIGEPGYNWIEVNTGLTTDIHFNSITYTGISTLPYVGVGNSGVVVIFKNEDLTNSTRISVGTENINDVIYDSYSDSVIFVGSSGTSMTASRESSFQTWTPIQSSTNKKLNTIIFDSNRTEYVAIGSSSAIYNVKFEKVGAAATAIVGAGGTIVSISITNPGFGYSVAPKVFIETPSPLKERFSSCKIEGDFGLVVGVGTSAVGVGTTTPRLLFTVETTTPGLTITGVSTGDYFVIRNSNIGNGTTSILSDGTVIGIGTTYLDNVYRVDHITRVGSSSTVTIHSNISSLSGITTSNNTEFGVYSWGRVYDFNTRSNAKYFDVESNPSVYRITGIGNTILPINA